MSLQTKFKNSVAWLATSPKRNWTVLYFTGLKDSFNHAGRFAERVVTLPGVAAVVAYGITTNTEILPLVLAAGAAKGLGMLAGSLVEVTADFANSLVNPNGAPRQKNTPCAKLSF